LACRNRSNNVSTAEPTEDSPGDRADWAVAIDKISPKTCWVQHEGEFLTQFCGAKWSLVPVEEPFPVANIYYRGDIGFVPSRTVDGLVTNTSDACRLYKAWFTVEIDKDALVILRHRGFRMIRFISDNFTVECSVG